MFIINKTQYSDTRKNVSTGIIRQNYYCDTHKRRKYYTKIITYRMYYTNCRCTTKDCRSEAN